MHKLLTSLRSFEILNARSNSARHDLGIIMQAEERFSRSWSDVNVPGSELLFFSLAIQEWGCVGTCFSRVFSMSKGVRNPNVNDS